jgi:hypothetical protein
MHGPPELRPPPPPYPGQHPVAPEVLLHQDLVVSGALLPALVGPLMHHALLYLSQVTVRHVKLRWLWTALRRPPRPWSLS